MTRHGAALRLVRAIAVVFAMAACGDETPPHVVASRPAPVTAGEQPSAPASLRRRASDADPASEPEPAADAEGRMRFMIHVVDAGTHAPVAGAVLAVSEDESKRETRTDAAGTARLDVQRKYAGTNVTVQAPGYAYRVLRIVAGADGSKPIEVELAPGTTITGTVLGTDGCAIAGATVQVSWWPDEQTVASRHDTDESPEWVAVCDASGRFAIDGVPKDMGGVLALVATAKGRVRTRVSWAPRGPPAEIRMAPAAAVTGTVRDPDGHPIEDAQVQLSMTDRPKEGASMRAWMSCVGSDEAGRYRFDGVPLGHKWSLVATHPAFADSELLDGLEVDGEATFDLALRPLAKLTVTVLGPDGAAVAEAWLTVEAGGRSRHSMQGGSSSFEVEINSPGPCRVVANTLRFAPKTVDLTVAAGESRALEIRVEAGAAIAGVVVDDAGQRVAGVRLTVYALPADRGVWWSTLRGDTSGADGSFRVGGLTDGAYRIDAECKGYEAARVEPVNAPTADARVVLRRFAHVGATFITKDDAPLPDRFWIRGTRPAGAKQGTGLADLAAWMGKTADISPGVWTLTISVDGYVPVVRDVDLAPGETRTIEKIELDPGVGLSGRVVDADGFGVEDAEVAAGGRSVKTDADGKFALEHVPRGDLDVDVTADDFLPARVRRASAAAGEFVVTLRRGGVLRGTVKDAFGAPVTLGRLEVLSTGATSGVAATIDLCDSGGEFEVRLPAGEYTIVASVAGGGARAKATVTEGRDATVDLVVGK